LEVENTYYFIEISAPPKAKSQSCVLHESGEVRPGLRPQPVRYSTQFGPPSAVPVCMKMSVDITLSLLQSFTDLILDYLIGQQLVFGERKVEVIADESRVLSSSGSLYICIGVSKGKPSIYQYQLTTWNFETLHILGVMPIESGLLWSREHAH
jgi:hypothetical protein